MTIGERIRSRRLELDMTQEELEYKCGYKSKISINKIELGRDNRTIKAEKAMLFAEALQCPISYLMGWDYEPEQQIANTESIEMIAAFTELEPKNKVIIKRLIDDLIATHTTK